MPQAARSMLAAVTMDSLTKFEFFMANSRKSAMVSGERWRATYTPVIRARKYLTHPRREAAVRAVTEHRNIARLRQVLKGFALIAALSCAACVQSSVLGPAPPAAE